MMELFVGLQVGWLIAMVGWRIFGYRLNTYISRSSAIMFMIYLSICQIIAITWVYPAYVAWVRGG